MRLIDADALRNEQRQRFEMLFLPIVNLNTNIRQDEARLALEKIENAPTIDAVPVVRCKDCKWFINDHNEVDGWMTCTLLRQEVDKEWFCANGER